MKRIFAAALIAATTLVAFPVAAQLSNSTLAAIANHNESADSQDDRIYLGRDYNLATSPDRNADPSRSTLAIIELHNRNADSQDDRIRTLTRTNRVHSLDLE